MKRLVLPFLALSALCVFPTAASAQERGDVGLVMAMPTDVGVMWHVSDKIAVRPEINFSFGSTEVDGGLGQGAEASRRGLSLETSVLFYLGAIDGVQTYVAPRVGFDWASIENDDTDNDISGGGMEVSLSYGAQYTPVSRFAVFGEIGLEYARAVAELDPSGNIESRNASWGPRTQVGVILYFTR